MATADRVMESSPLLLKVEEAAQLLGIARTSMFQLLAPSQIESVRVGRLRRVPLACLEEYVDRLREQDRPGSQSPSQMSVPSGDG